MNLSELIKSLKPSGENFVFPDFPIKGISCKSRETGPGFVFVAVKGAKHDGNKFIEEAVSLGSEAIVLKSENRVFKIKEKNKIVFIEVADDRKALVDLACAFYGNPSAGMNVSGVTGTNGKTTITYLQEAVLKECGNAAGVIGTNNWRFKDKIISSGNTTPGPLELQLLFAQMRDSGVSHALMEVSSHALDQGRVGRINFSSAIFTNLTQDHLDYHQNLENYFLAKAKLFRGLSKDSWAVINNDDPYGLRIKEFSRCGVITYGIDSVCDVRAVNLNLSLASSEFLLRTEKGAEKFKIGLIGRHNIYNVLAVFSWAVALGLDLEKAKNALEEFTSVPGRLERFDSSKGFIVFVDYAHTEDALQNVLSALKQIHRGRIIVVFGCGGERDKSKRPKMGSVVSRLADYAIITNDNPRSEDPEEIIKNIKSGFTKDNFCVIFDRMEAIREALLLAKQGDIVLVAGKGHEDYQVFKDKSEHFDDREAVRKCLPR
ncbi:MAG: UDP-N-acetylmuramoyl-L-alanyl-D-glutamate--2,6-diaminopimelate ligase [Candidatus Omnitrophota bacterium]